MYKRTNDEGEKMFEFNPDGSLKIPENINHSGFEDEEHKDRIEKEWHKLRFDLKYALQNMSFLSSFKSKRNHYFVYELNGIYLVSTGLKDMSRFNIVPKKDVEEVYNLINTKMGLNRYFSTDDLVNALSTNTFISKRLEMIRTDADLKSPLNEFYVSMLNICYVLVGKGEATIDFNSKSVVFRLGKYKVFQSKDIFSNLKYIGNATETRVIFEDDVYYYSIQCKNFRGSISLFLKTEIKSLIRLVEEIPIGNMIDVSLIIDKMDYYERCQDIYNFIMDKNVRTGRDLHHYFDGRVKSALRIVNLVRKLLLIEKDGRNLVFTRIKNSSNNQVI